ncbi:hypothetical protein QFC24_004112 [Naganishia onofrii]|uniref:Uncharacterized protein n=1 Tax=Naganishia onofrii TaxID=1851511 RepID=A0ACC2XFT6_9TREE|nr:hypothetical protein QFC24_004112 [Naganishia onofrii]
MAYLLPPPRSRSRSSLKPPGKEDEESSNNSSLAEPRVANVEVTSRWSTTAINPRLATKELRELQGAHISTAVDKPVNPFLSGFRSEHLKRSNSVSKQKPSPLRPTHQRHVSAPMVSGSIANFRIAPPLEVRPQARENTHRKATTALSRQPSRLEMRNRDVAGPDSPFTQKGMLSTISTKNCITVIPAATKNERPVLSRASSSSWTRNFLDGNFMPGRLRNVADADKSDYYDIKSELEQNCFGAAVVEKEEGGDEEELEVFLGLDDI